MVYGVFGGCYSDWYIVGYLIIVMMQKNIVVSLMRIIM